MCLHLPRIEARRATYSIAGPWYCPKCPGIGAIGEKRVEFSLPQGRRPNSSGNYQFPADLVGLHARPCISAHCFGVCRLFVSPI